MNQGLAWALPFEGAWHSKNDAKLADRRPREDEGGRDATEGKKTKEKASDRDATGSPGGETTFGGPSLEPKRLPTLRVPVKKKSRGIRRRKMRRGRERKPRNHLAEHLLRLDGRY